MTVADRAGRADDADARSLRLIELQLERVVQRGHRARDVFGATWHAILIGDVEMTFDSTPISSSVANVFAAMPGWLFIPAPTRLTLPRSSRIDHSTPSDREQLLAGLAILERRAEDDLVGA